MLESFVHLGDIYQVGDGEELIVGDRKGNEVMMLNLVALKENRVVTTIVRPGNNDGTLKKISADPEVLLAFYEKKLQTSLRELLPDAAANSARLFVETRLDNKI
jgi:hypothetical protein